VDKKRVRINFLIIHPNISRPAGDGDNRKLSVNRIWAVKHEKKHILALKSTYLTESIRS
jgi:hypothetical protein